MTDVSISIVNYNSSDLVVKAIRSVIKYTRGLTFEVIVTNNSPEDAGFNKIAANFGPDLRLILIDMHGNTGFAKANNTALAAATGQYFLVFNPDLYLEMDSISACHAFLEKNPLYTACTAGFNYPDGSSQPSAFFKQHGARFFYNAIPYIQLLKKIPENYSVPDTVTPRLDVGVLCGAFIFVRREAYINIGGFDEEFFLYGEDWEISNRLATQGRMALLNDTRVIHMHGGASAREFQDTGSELNVWTRKGTQMFISVMLWQKKEFGNGELLKLNMLMWLSLVLSFIMMAVKLFRNPYRKRFGIFVKNYLVMARESVLMIAGRKKVYRTM